MKYHLVYKTTNTLNNRYYIGMHSTNNPDDGYLGSGNILRASINKYGAENHSIVILYYCNSRQELAKKEFEEISEHKNDILCMNIADGGFGGATRRGAKHTEETKLKIKASLMGHKHSEETRIKIGLKSKGRNVGKKFSLSHRLNISKAKKGMPSKLKGIPRTEETKRKISEANKGKVTRIGYVLSEETRKKISLSNKGKTRSEEFKQITSKRMKGYTPSDITRKRLSEKAKLQWQRYKEQKLNPSAP